MIRKSWLAAGLLVLLCVPAHLDAQGTGAVQGTVVEATSRQPLSGVQVIVVGTTIGGVTNDDGRFLLLNVPVGQRTIRAELIGFRLEDQPVTVRADGTATASFVLTQTAVELERLQVVVTALGIERQERTITTSVQSVTGDQLTRTPESNLVAALSGKISGVSITNSNVGGGSSRIVIRGANSLTGNNQPLFVLDGIPVSNATGTNPFGSMGYNAIDYGNMIQDLQPSDIESVSVLKGPNAAALYGSRAANGAIIITTKTGRRQQGLGIGLTATSTLSFERPLKLPEYQNLYGQGWNGRYSYLDGRGNGVYDDYDESWGPRLDMGLMIPQFFSNGQPAPWASHPDNVSNFFETGRTANTSVAFSTTTDRSSTRLSIARLDQDGMYPGFAQARTTLGLNSSIDLADRLRAHVSAQYTNSDGENRPAQGYGADNFMWQFLWFGRQVDTGILKSRLRNEDGSQFNWNNRWNNNPYWTATVNENVDNRDRIIGSASVSYDVMNWLTATLRSGTDWSQDTRRRLFAAGTIGQTGVDPNGAFGESNVFRQETNTDFLLSTKPRAFGDVTVSTNFGGNRRDNSYRSNGVYVRNLVVPELYDLGNAAVTPDLSDWREEQRVNSLYGSAQFGFREFLFVDVTGRNDWSSTLPATSNSYFYPSVSAGLVFSDLATIPGLTYGKVRIGWAEVGNDADPYQLVDPYIADVPFGSVPRYTASNRLRNYNLKPETTRSWEVGAELRFLDGRVAFDGTYYNKLTFDQILPIQTTALTGFTSRMLNAGSIRNKGVELMVNALPVRLANGLSWEVTLNWSRNDNMVEELWGDLESIVLGTYYGVQVVAKKGEPYGQMYGRKYVRDSQGSVVVGTNGLPLNVATNPNGVLGNYNPDWNAGINNRIRYGPLDLSFLIDRQSGGSIYSLTNVYGTRSGVLSNTVLGREEADANGAPITPANGGGLIVPGVRVVAGDTVPNTVRVAAQSYHRGLTGLHENFVYDASFTKLREVRLGYDVPRSLTSRMRMARMSLALVGRNLILWSDVPNIDPETAFNPGNVQGFEYSQPPSARSIGFSITVTP
ncbi:MAG TPA: SusC/RagA family TonB-linked outer membrane protein [Longimicrobiales bacterium]|nr:SusC/RagA family TonB-linked outer membrane protein [Longimicrobiales bacterium]